MFHTESIKYGPVTVFLLYYDDFVTEEHLHNLLPNEQVKLQSLNHPSRRREFVATRVLRTMHFGNEPILYSKIGAPMSKRRGLFLFLMQIMLLEWLIANLFMLDSISSLYMKK